MTTIQECNVSTLFQGKIKTRTAKTVHNHAIVATGTHDNEDKFICSNKKDIKKWLKCAKDRGECEGLRYRPAYTTKNFWGKKIYHPATYEYDTNWGDNAQSVREIFNLKQGALKKHNGPIYDILEPFQGKTIIFEENDIMP